MKEICSLITFQGLCLCGAACGPVPTTLYRHKLLVRESATETAKKCNLQPCSTAFMRNHVIGLANRTHLSVYFWGLANILMLFLLLIN